MNPETRAEAQALGKRQYFTGKPCRNGHTAYRYTQSGTCSACIAESTAGQRRTLAATLPPERAARRDLVADLVELRLRAYPSDADTLRDMAAALCCARYPTLAAADVTVRVAPVDLTAGTGLYRVRVPDEHVRLMRDTAAALLNAHRVDLSGFHTRQVERAAAFAPPPAAVPEWGFQ
jgi:hypothetical protein